MLRLGGCQCGAVRYESAGEPAALYICHCRECQKQSGSAFGMSLLMPRSGLRVTRGAQSFWARPTASGARLDCAFCRECGSRLWHASDATPRTVTIKAGSLDDALDAFKAIHLWTVRKLPGIIIPPGAVQFPKEPY